MEVQKIDYFERRDYLSNSSLGLLEVSPGLFKKSLDGSLEKKEALSLERGSLLHLWILEPEKFIVSDVEPITGKLGDFITGVYVDKLSEEEAHAKAGFKQSLESIKRSKNYRDKETEINAYINFLKESEGKICFSSKTREILENCYNSLRDNNEARKLLFDDYLEEGDTAENEVEIYLDNLRFHDKYNVDDIGIKAKCKVDRLIKHSDGPYKYTLVDLKTTSEFVGGEMCKLSDTGVIFRDYYTSNFFRSFLKYRYHRQMAYYRQMVADHYGVSVNGIRVMMVAVEMQGTFDSCVYQINDRILDYGIKEIKVLIEIYKRRRKLDKWDWKDYIYDVM